ncbi:MAG: hypothetical protein IJ438_05885 [Clostridia bacterium]|nr:hypothetical protein [Clostridia bacterium]
MAKIHAFIARHIRLLKWIPWINHHLLLYYLIRTTFITRRSVTFREAVTAMGISAGAAILTAVISHYLPVLITTLSSNALRNMLMPLVITFIVVPAFISMLVKTDEHTT